jgi:heme/copper-type cytochrome/quinol oxidase subunit 2
LFSSEIGLSSFEAYLTGKKESRENRQLSFFFIGLLLINFIFLLFLKMYAFCFIKIKLSVGKAKIKNLVSFNNLLILVILTVSAIVSGVVYTQQIVDEKNEFIPIMLSVIGNTLLTSSLVGNKDALEFANLKFRKFMTRWNQKNIFVNKVVPEVPQMFRQPRGGQELVEMIDLNC